MSIWDDVKNVVGGVAPMLGTAIGGPFGGIAGSLIAKYALDVDDKEAENISKKLNSKNPMVRNGAAKQLKIKDQNVLLKIKEAENEFNVLMNEMNIDEMDLNYKNVKDARNMAQKTSIWPQICFTTTIFLMIGFVVFLLVDNLNVEGSNQLILGTLLTLAGALVNALSQSLNFWFGPNNKEKDEQMNNHQDQLVRMLNSKIKK